MKKDIRKYIGLLFFLLTVQSIAQTFTYSGREYYDYNEGKKQMVLASKDKVISSLTIKDKNNTIEFRITGVKEFAVYDNVIRKGIMTSKSGKSFLHYVYVGPKNDVLHFYISKESSKIESYGSMLRLIE